jgi:hypothetical protein
MLLWRPAFRSSPQRKARPANVLPPEIFSARRRLVPAGAPTGHIAELEARDAKACPGERSGYRAHRGGIHRSAGSMAKQNRDVRGGWAVIKKALAHFLPGLRHAKDELNGILRTREGCLWTSAPRRNPLKVDQRADVFGVKMASSAAGLLPEGKPTTESRANAHLIPSVRCSPQPALLPRQPTL